MVKNVSKKENESLDNVCKLLEYRVEEDDIGNQVKTLKNEKAVFCSEIGMYANEFFAAGKAGIRLSKTLVIQSDEYEKEEKVEYDGEIYSVYRVYARDNGFTELYLEQKINE